MYDSSSIPLQKTLKLFKWLNEQDIRYCHWKSNSHLMDGLSGKTDLDLLVDRKFETEFMRIIAELGFKLLLSPRWKQIQGILDFLGFDEFTGQLIHLHVHYQLILGEYFVKSYRVPFEKVFLSSTERTKEGIIVPVPEIELLFLVTRFLLKIRLRDLHRFADSSILREFREEFDYLLAQIDSDRFFSSCNILLPVSLCKRFLSFLGSEKFSATQALRLRSEVRRQLKIYRRIKPLKAKMLYFSYALTSKIPWKKPAKKTLSKGGISIAFIGADGSGKSTLVNEIEKWLSWKLCVQSIHLGSKDACKLTRLSFLLARFQRRFLMPLHHRDRQSLTEAIRTFLITRDKRRKHGKGMQMVSRGQIVIFDRFPIPELRSVMDWHEVDSYKDRSLPFRCFLAKANRRSLESIYAPDMLILLEVDGSTAKTRKPQHRAEVIGKKIASMRKVAEYYKNAVHINTAESLPETLCKLKRQIWNLL